MTESSGPTMSSSRPYLLRALLDWINDNGLTPQILIDTRYPHVQVPEHLSSEERLVLNISPTAVRDLMIEDEILSFVARFAGVSRGVVVPVSAIHAIYARENGQGMMFPDVDEDDTPPDDDPGNAGTPGQRPRSKARLKVVK